MPDSGVWASEQVFSIPLAPGVDSRSPGLVIFECSPLHGLQDEIEKWVIQSLSSGIPAYSEQKIPDT